MNDSFVTAVNKLLRKPMTPSEKLQVHHVMGAPDAVARTVKALRGTTRKATV